MSKQTAVEYLIQEIKHAACVKSKSMSEWNKVFTKAIAMEREQIVDAFCKGYDHVGDSYDNAEEQYYNETYKGGEK